LSKAKQRRGREDAKQNVFKKGFKASADEWQSRRRGEKKGRRVEESDSANCVALGRDGLDKTICE
jgi:hypothetical protein